MEDELKEKFLNYPIPKQIIEEYNKVFSYNLARQNPDKTILAL